MFQKFYILLQHERKTIHIQTLRFRFLPEPLFIPLILILEHWPPIEAGVFVLKPLPKGNQGGTGSGTKELSRLQTEDSKLQPCNNR